MSAKNESQTKSIEALEVKIDDLDQKNEALERLLDKPGLDLTQVRGEIDEAILGMQAAVSFQVPSNIHPEDHIFSFLRQHEKYRNDIEGAYRYYFSTGDESVEKLVALKKQAGMQGTTSLLEFAAGYGCVTRHLKKRPEEFELVACDIHQQAVDFVAKALNAKAVGSVTDPDAFQLDKKYGIVFALSFFSHMPKKTWGRWLAALFRTVDKGGCLIFTTHGLVSQAKMMPHAIVGESGFWFNENSEQADLDTADYGSTITTPKFVREEIAKLEGAVELAHHEAYWWTHQDAWVVKKLG
ncbi:class I SAM-dependent methyltransferase [Hydrogenophaga crassostreae]|uniref:class I SAM-dependent methyltransferase n=1 Tax=Hydrogenophaga crassostreae TaxID=1763535 RepID=UPI0012FC5242|nr:class I SAM-dependent methyltransferase [Hydrogenophaga crassostreae]